MGPSDSLDQQSKPMKGAVESSLPSGNLALLYEALLTGIVRLQASRQQIPDGESFRRKTKTTLQEIEHVAVASGYDAADVKDTNFAIVALLDSVVLRSNDPVRSEWERKTLQEELFGQTDAGVVFFEKLDHFRSRRDSKQLSDVLEVYLLCLLLGFEGRFSGFRGELEGITERTKMRITDIRGHGPELSPSGNLPAVTAAPQQTTVQPNNRFLVVTLSAVIVTIVCFILMRISLAWSSQQLLNRWP